MKQTGAISLPLQSGGVVDLYGSMTGGAQQALRRTMEIYSSTTRFAFACNQSNKIIEPLQSRCAILRYARLTDQQVIKRLMEIIVAEDVKYSEEGLAALIFTAEGDMRQAINNLQSTVAGFGFVNGDNVFKVVDTPHPIAVQTMIKACYECNIDAALEKLDELWAKGYSAVDVISTMFRVTKTIDTLSEHAKLEFIRVSLDQLEKKSKLLTAFCSGNWVHTYADLGGSVDTSPAPRLYCQTMQDQYGSQAVYN